MRAGLCLFAFFLSAPIAALEINQASEAELDNLRGLGPAFTRRVLAARAEHAFVDWPDLMRRVKGMGQATAKKLSAQGLTVQGQALLDKAQPLSQGLP
ncbi:MAG: helix-hairpin-helix domain-containing protein [Betaproteobacteria bacterium]|nr:helix-hairpin-helix domain-containing protein [Betaproteobacteria bacterium]